MLVFSFGMLFSQAPIASADPVVSSASVTNVAPVASAALIAGGESLTLTENTTTDVTITVTVTDNDGCADIDSVAVVFYSADATNGAGCTANNADCYNVAATIIGGSCTGPTDVDALYTATIAVQYYADPVVWTALVIPTDGDGASASTDNDTATMNTLTALNVSSTLVYGALARGANTETGDTPVTVTNTGNVIIDITVDGYGASDGDTYSMTCTAGTIPIANEKYSMTGSTAYASKTALSDTATAVQMDIAVATSVTPTTGSLYFGFAVPADGVSGSCTGTVVFAAISN